MVSKFAGYPTNFYTFQSSLMAAEEVLRVFLRRGVCLCFPFLGTMKFFIQGKAWFENVSRKRNEWIFD